MPQNIRERGDHSLYILGSFSTQLEKRGSFSTKCNKMEAIGVEIHRIGSFGARYTKERKFE